MLRPDSNKFARRPRAASAFSLVELLAVIAIMAVLLAVSAQFFSNSSNHARQASRDIIKAHLQQARAHAIASGKTTAVVIPVLGTGGELGGRAISLFEVDKSGDVYISATDENGDERLLQRWEILPGNFYFIPASMIASSSPTIVDSPDTLQTNYKGNLATCHFIVFAPNGQIILPASAVNIAIAKATNRGGSLVLTEKTGGRPAYEFLQVNRFSGRTRSIQP